MDLIRIRYSDTLIYGLVYQWLDENCVGKFYTGTDWTNWETGSKNKMIEFELESDAVQFALRWT